MADEHRAVAAVRLKPTILENLEKLDLELIAVYDVCEMQHLQLYALWRNCIRWYCTGFLHNAFELGLLAVFLCVFKLIKRRLTSGRALQSPLRCDLGSIGTGMFMMQPNCCVGAC